MSKLLYCCLKKKIPSKNAYLLSDLLAPDNITFHPPKIIDLNGIWAVIFNPNDSILIKNSSICMGNILESDLNWWEPLSNRPDGTFALFRGNSKYIELITDVVASRTIWYYYDENKFIASTSQRAIVIFLQSFKFNRMVIPWMFSTGTIGPGNSWDLRIKCIKPDTSLLLDRILWKIKLEKSTCFFTPIHKKKSYLKENLKAALDDTFHHIDFDSKKWIVPLSGGYDSRYILSNLKDRDELKCVTWGVRESLLDKENDAYIARILSEYYNKDHAYFELDNSNETLETIFSRFLISGEGRVEHIAGYLDGFKIWKTLYENNIIGIIRGDEGFGWKPVSTALEVRKHIGITLLSDYTNYKNFSRFNLPKQCLPDDLSKHKNETLSAWRDRLYHEFRIPALLAGLNDLKLSYVEIINPLLSKKIINQVRKQPDHLRTNKKLYKIIVNERCPDIPIAKNMAIQNRANFLKREKVVSVIEKELNSPHAQFILSNDLIYFILKHIETSKKVRNNKPNFKSSVKKLIPHTIREKIRNAFIKDTMDFHLLAFRAYLISRMTHTLTKDAKILSSQIDKV